MPIWGERVRQVRKLRRLTQLQLAKATGIKQFYLSRIESGMAQPCAGVIDAISMATGFAPAFFHRPPGPDIPLGSLLFRSRRATTRTDIEEAHAWAEVVFECYMGLASRVEPIKVVVPSLLEESPIHAAQIARSSLGISPDRPIPNLVNALERSGVFVIALPVPLSGRDAFSAWTSFDRRIPVIAIPCGATGDRLRFSVSHELAHLVIHHSYKGYIRDIEAEADRFAGEFLMPESGIRGELRTPISLTGLEPSKRRWGVSIQALIMRARHLGIVSERRAQQLFKAMLRSGTIRREPEHTDIPIEKPRAFRKLAELAYGNPLDARKLAADYSIPLSLASSIINAHAERHEVVSTVPVSNLDHEKNIVRFPQKHHLNG